MLHTANRDKAGMRRFLPEMTLVVVTMIWGVTFLVVHHGLAMSGPLFIVGCRFAVAAVAAAAFAGRALRGLTRRELVAGAAIGCGIFGGHALQAAGLQTITSSQSAFITAVYVPLVPLLQWALLGRRPRLASWVGIALATAGLLLVAGPGASGLGAGRGEVLTLLGAIAIAAEILLIGRFAGRVDLARVTAVQLAVTALLAFATMPVAGEAVPAFSWTLAAIVAGLGLASAGIQIAMNWAQATVSPTRATLIYAGEPVWAGLVGRLAGDRLPASALAGGALIVVAVVVSELDPFRRRRPPQKPSSPGSSGASAAAAAA
jgi:drug/metabolite transporter (DMT)-like permease